MLPNAYSYRRRGLCVPVLGTPVSLAETAEPIEMPFGRKQTGAGRRDHALDAWCTWVVAGRYNNNNNNYDNVYGAIIMTKVIARVHPVQLMNAACAPCGRQPSDQANRLGLCFPENWQLPSSPTLCPPDVRYPRAAAMRICVTLL